MDRPRPLWLASMFACLLPLAAAAAEGETAEQEGPEAPERLELTTTDGVNLAAWHYPPWSSPNAPADPKTATVILVHDLAASHATVEPLALSLQGKGFRVLSPDLRGHGDSRNAAGSGRRPPDASQLRKPDLEAIAATSGGSVREQASVQGDLETLRSWLKSGGHGADADRICVVGVGLGATLASLWVANDWAWGDQLLASGPQGKTVRGLVLVSPVWSSKGVTISPALNAPGVKDSIPILLIGGSADRDAPKLFEQLRRARPASWFEQRAGGEPKSSPDLAKASDASLFLIQFNSPLAGDKLLASPAAGAVDRVAGFLSLVLDRRAK